MLPSVNMVNVTSQRRIILVWIIRMLQSFVKPYSYDE